MWNVSEQISEAYKEEVKKWYKQAKRTRKDEKKARKQDLLLAKYLVKILLNKNYDTLLPSLFRSFDDWVPSNLILGILSLVYSDISDTIRWYRGKSGLNFHYYSEDTLECSGDTLPQEIKDRINLWVEDIQTVCLLNPSILYTNRVKKSLKNSEEVYTFTKKVLIYFFSECNVYIREKTASDYTGFILRKILLPYIEKQWQRRAS